MKTTIAVEAFEITRRRSLERARKLDRRDHVSSERRISFEHPEDMAAYLTTARIELLKAAMQQPRSVTELATAVDRTRSAVSRDIRALSQVGLVELNRRSNPGHGQVQIVSAPAKSIDLYCRLTA